MENLLVIGLIFSSFLFGGCSKQEATNEIQNPIPVSSGSIEIKPNIKIPSNISKEAKLVNSLYGYKYYTDGKKYWQETGEEINQDDIKVLITEKEAIDGTTDLDGNKLDYPPRGYFLSNKGTFVGDNFGGAYGIRKLSDSNKGIKVLPGFGIGGILEVDGKKFDWNKELTGAIVNSKIIEAIPGFIDLIYGKDWEGKKRISLYTDGVNVWFLGDRLFNADLKTLKATLMESKEVNSSYLFTDKKSCYGAEVNTGMQIFELKGCNPQKIYIIKYRSTDKMWPGYTDGVRYWGSEGTKISEEEMKTIVDIKK